MLRFKFNQWNEKIGSKEIEILINNLSPKKIQEPNSFTGKFYQTYKEKNNTDLYKFFHDTEEDGTLPNRF